MRNSFFLLILFAHTVYSQELLFDKPVKMGPQINTTAEEIAPMLSSDGKSFYFVRSFYSKNIGGQFAGSDIWRSVRSGTSTWQTSTNNLSKWNNNSNNAIVGLRKDNSAVYLSNSYKGKGGIARSSLIGDNWTSPEKINLPGIDATDFVGYYVSPDEEVMFISMKDKTSVGEEDLYVSLKDSLGNWTLPVSVSTTINTEGFEIAPFLSSDKKRLYFTSNGHPGYGDADIFVSERLYDSWTVWTKPRNLGLGINSEKFDAYFSIYGDSVAYFSSNRDSELSDIFQVRVNKKKEEIFTEQINYLTDEEIRKLTTSKFENQLAFPELLTELSGNHKNKLATLVNLMLVNKDIKTRLLVRYTNSQDEKERYQKRLLNILDYLKGQGLEGARITFGSENDDSISKVSTETVFIKLYR